MQDMADVVVRVGDERVHEEDVGVGAIGVGFSRVQDACFTEHIRVDVRHRRQEDDMQEVFELDAFSGRMWLSRTQMGSP